MVKNVGAAKNRAGPSEQCICIIHDAADSSRRVASDQVNTGTERVACDFSLSLYLGAFISPGVG